MTATFFVELEAYIHSFCAGRTTLLLLLPWWHGAITHLLVILSKLFNGRCSSGGPAPTPRQHRGRTKCE